MLALTVLEPWASLIIGSPTAPAQKRIENRTWAPGPRAIGQRIAIHAGKRIDDDAMRWLAAVATDGWVIPPYPYPSDYPWGAIIGTVVVSRIVTSAVDGLDADARWFTGPIGWVLTDPIRFERPLPARGRQRLWEVPEELREAVRR